MKAQSLDSPRHSGRNESEAFHSPGLIQPHGALIGLDTATLRIQQVSENSERLLGFGPRDLLGKSPAVFLGERQFEPLRDALRAPLFETGVHHVIVGSSQEPMECLASEDRGCLLLELAPTRGVHSLDLLDVSLVLQAPLSRMERSSSLDDLVGIVAKEVRAISGFDRVMVYRFDEDRHGVVIAEDVSERLPMQYLGHHFPAADIPARFRSLYLLNTLRLIPDIDYLPVAIVDDLRDRSALDLSRSDLRSVSPCHLQYLRNLDIRATLTISVIVHGKLWGLVACHHKSPRRISNAVRSICHVFAQMLATKLTARLDREELTERLDSSERISRLVSTFEPTRSLFDALRDSWTELLTIFSADALLVRSIEGTALYGSSLSFEELRPAIACLQAAAQEGIASSSSLSGLDERAKRFASTLSGALYISLSTTDDRCVVILRREQRASVRWAGNPNKPAYSAKGRLTPRASFETWEEAVSGESVRWSAADRRNAVNLRGQLIDWQQAGTRAHLLAHYDALTQLPNRRLVDELLKHALEDAKAQNGLVALLFIDIDRFKRFNDRLGHAAGDRVLRHVAGRMSQIVRDGDIVGRLGGDEFVIIMPNLSNSYSAEGISRRLLDDIAQPIPGFEAHDLRVTASIGISVFPSDGTTSEILLTRADAAMYRVKESGRNAWKSYQSSLTGPPSELAQRTLWISQALDRSEIVAHFQPIVDLANGRVVAVEALARWNHPTSGLLGPAAFIEVAEETDLIVRLGETMLDLSCREAKRWRRTSEPNLRVAVNVSPRQLRDFGFVTTVREILKRYELPADALELEITEGMLAGDTSQSISALHALAEIGVRITIDDFGTGYSSLNYLRRLPVKSLKIDQTFVAELDSAKTIETGSAVIRAIITLAKGFGLEVVAEGVESQAQLKILREFGCDYAQGYLIGRPLSAAAYSKFSTTF